MPVTYLPDSGWYTVGGEELPVTPADWDNLVTGAEQIVRHLAEVLGRGIMRPTDFNGSVVTGQIAVDMSIGDAFIGLDHHVWHTYHDSVVRVTAANGLVANTTNYIFLKKDRTFIANTTGTAPAESELCISVVMGSTQATSFNQLPAGRKNLKNPITLSGLAANRPAFGVAGRFYFSTDTAGGTLYYDTGAAWQQVAAGVTEAHVLATSSALGPLHTVSGLTTGHVLKALSATTAAFGQLLHNQLGGIGANDHHNQAHAINGADHTLSGATAGHILAAQSATTFGFEAPGTRVVLSGIFSARPAAAISGRLYFSTDTNGGTLYRDNGSGWDQLARGLTEALAGDVTGSPAANTVGKILNVTVPALAGNARKFLALDSGGVWQFANRFGSRVVVVAPAEGDYTTLTAAHTAITTASASNPWCIVVTGAITETGIVSAKSNVSVFFLPGASVTVDTTVGTHAVSFASVVNSHWKAHGYGPHIIRQGLISTNGVYGLVASGGDGTTTIDGIRVVNNVTHAGSPNSCGGAIFQTTPNYRVLNCEFVGANTGSSSSASGLSVSTGSCYFEGVIGRGGGGTGNSNHGILIVGNASSHTFTRCRAYGGGSGTGTGNQGISITANGTLVFDTCIAEGGLSTGISNAGISISSTTNLVVSLRYCHAKGGDNGASSTGLTIGGGSLVLVNGGVYRGGAGGTTSPGVSTSGQAMSYIRDATLMGGGCNTFLTGTYNYLSGTPSFVMDASKPLRIVGARITVTSATPGATVTLADDAVNTNPYGAAVSLAAVTTVIIDITGHQIAAAGGSVFTNVAGGTPADGSFTVTWLAEISFGGATTVSCSGFFPDSTGYTEVRNSVILSNSDSNAMYIRTNGQLRTSLFNTVLRSGPRTVGTRKKAIDSTGAWNPAPVYQCVLDGGQTNVTCAAGVANGTCVEV